MGTSYGGFVAASVVAFLAASHYAQQWMPPPKPRIIGVDLGTTYSCAGVYQAGTGEVQILEDDAGRRIIPSVVSYASNGDIVVGEAARARAATSPKDTVYEAKRFIGKPFSAVQSDIDAGNFPFEVVDLSGSPAFRVAGPSPTGTRLVTPEEVGASVLMTLKATAEARLNGRVSQAVMSVPVEFTSAQRDATTRAASLAGLEVLRILNEPTAAALAYGLHTKAEVDLIVVFDWGGGTLDVSLLGVEGGMFTTHAISGNKHLGGEDITRRLHAHLLDAYLAERQRRQRSGGGGNNGDGGDPSPELLQRLRTEAERIKLELSDAETSTLVLESDGGGEPAFVFDVSRDTFENITADLFAKAMEPLYAVIAEAEVEPSSVDEIVLVGGSTRMPKIREQLAQFLGKPPCSSIDPDEAVAVGVAMQAGIVAGAWPLQVSALEIPFDQRDVEPD